MVAHKSVVEHCDKCNCNLTGKPRVAHIRHADMQIVTFCMLCEDIVEKKFSEIVAAKILAMNDEEIARIVKELFKK